MTISKSQYIKGLQCHKYLWLQKKRPELRDTLDSAQISLYNSGTNVGELACELFPGGVEVKFTKDDFNAMLSKTKALIANGTDVIYEATFSEDGIFAMADILVRRGDKWDMYEVKGSTGVKDAHIDDAAIQWYALSKAIELDRAFIVHINNQYVRDGELDVQQLFAIADITDQVQDKQYKIEASLDEMYEMLQNAEPDIDIGGHCSSPYNCEFRDHCWKNIPSPSIFNLYWMNGAK